jgi:hypothetical protein
MTPGRRLPLAVLCLLWAGMVIGISFIEAPVKFRAPTLSRTVALDVGRTVFHASQLVQAGLGVLVLAAALVGRAARRVWLYLAAAGLALAVQMAWVFPVLDARARAILAGQAPSGANPHALYGVLEVFKVLTLSTAAILALRQDGQLER